MVIERAFGRLKGTWRILMTPFSETQCLTVGACCVLHNISIAMGQSYKEGELKEYLEDEEQAKKVRRYECVPAPVPGPLSGKDIGDLLMYDMLEQCPPGWVPRVWRPDV